LVRNRPADRAGPLQWKTYPLRLVVSTFGGRGFDSRTRGPHVKQPKGHFLGVYHPTPTGGRGRYPRRRVSRKTPDKSLASVASLEEGEAILPRQVGSPSESGRCRTRRLNATYWGRLVRDKIVETIIGKVPYQFCGSLPRNDDLALPDMGCNAISVLRCNRGFRKPDALKPSRNAEPCCRSIRCLTKNKLFVTRIPLPLDKGRPYKCWAALHSIPAHHNHIKRVTKSQNRSISSSLL
jgi:hypothetical protein